MMFSEEQAYIKLAGQARVVRYPGNCENFVLVAVKTGLLETKFGNRVIW